MRGWLLAAGGGVVLAGAAFAAVYLALFNASATAPLRLTPTSTTSGQLSAATAAGTWSVASGSVVGYRVREKLAFLPAKSDAVGRTSEVAGPLTLTRSGSGLALSAASFVADVRALTSDRSMRDMRIHSIGLQSDQYPTARFTLTRPLVLPASALRGRGRAFHVTADGRLTIHGTTRSVAIPLTGQITGTRIEVVGALTFPFEEFGMQVPSVAGFVSVEDHATMELDLRFQHGASARNAAMLRTITALKPVSSAGGSLPPNGGPGQAPPSGSGPTP